MSLQEKAFGKINLHLNVKNKRADGFHDIFSIMARINLYDLMSLSYCKLEKGESIIDVDIVNRPGEYSSVMDEIPIEENLITKASVHYLKSLGYGGKLVFEIEKRMPSGAGLGGGSSDSATAIKLIEKHMGLQKNREAFEAALQTGSDVPFFLEKGICIAESRGEILSPVDFKPRGKVLLVNTGISINTAWAYGGLGREQTASAGASGVNGLTEQMKNSFKDKDLWSSAFYNDFEDLCFMEYPVLKKVKERIYESGAFFSLMTGSGSTVFGVYEDELMAQKLMNEFKNEGFWAELTNFV